MLTFVFSVASHLLSPHPVDRYVFVIVRYDKAFLALHRHLFKFPKHTWNPHAHLRQPDEHEWCILRGR